MSVTIMLMQTMCFSFLKDSWEQAMRREKEAECLSSDDNTEEVEKITDTLFKEYNSLMSTMLTDSGKHKHSDEKLYYTYARNLLF